MVAVIVAREATDHPWQDHRWRPAEALIGAANRKVGEVIAESDGRTDYFAGNFEIELHRKETPAYVVNLENEPPSIYVVLRESDEDEDAALPYVVEAVTVSPFEAQDYLDSGEEIVEPLALSEPLIAWIDRFVTTHHEEEKFIKRRRDRVNLADEKFGQEPIHIVRQRQKPRSH